MLSQKSRIVRDYGTCWWREKNVTCYFTILLVDYVLDFSQAYACQKLNKKHPVLHNNSFCQFTRNSPEDLADRIWNILKLNFHTDKCEHSGEFHALIILSLQDACLFSVSFESRQFIIVGVRSKQTLTSLYVWGVKFATLNGGCKWITRGYAGSLYKYHAIGPSNSLQVP